MTFAETIAALPTRSEWQAGLDSIRADLRDIKQAVAREGQAAAGSRISRAEVETGSRLSCGTGASAPRSIPRCAPNCRIRVGPPVVAPRRPSQYPARGLPAE